jgi:microsomal dipeptidase-like Zn-dependent dipeptidase/FAD/FMN-containing dehydrogenase
MNNNFDGDWEGHDREPLLLDLHAHYAMHLSEHATQGARGAMTNPRRKGLPEKLRAWLLRSLNNIDNFPAENQPAVTVENLRAAGAGAILSVLYAPFDEIDLKKRYASPPDAGYIDDILGQMQDVENDIQDNFADHAAVVHNHRELADARRSGKVALLHAIEGGFQLGDTPKHIEENVQTLAGFGLAYVTVAHLFFRQVATNAPAIPFLPDWLYGFLFQQPRIGLTDLGCTVIHALVRNRILIDLTHMSKESIDATLNLLDKIDPEREVPVVVTHGAYRFGKLKYNLSDEHIRRISKRKGVIGLIACDHLMVDGIRGPTAHYTETLEILRRHIDKIYALTGTYDNIAIGSDLDGFIKPSLAGLEFPQGYNNVRAYLTRHYGNLVSAKIFNGNARRLLDYWRGNEGPGSLEPGFRSQTPVGRPNPGCDGFHHPESEDEIRSLIHFAHRTGRKLRVRGAGHSIGAAIYTDGFAPGMTPDRDVNVMLDQMAGLCFHDPSPDGRTIQVTVQAGCHLGFDPSDPTQRSNPQNSLFYQLEQRGWALPDMGGITHQTVGGFLATGSAGGSLTHAFGDQIVSIRFMDGMGRVHDVSESQCPDLFYAAGVSLGLLGVICAVTFQCVQRFDVKGEESTTPLEHTPIDFFGPGTHGIPSLRQFLQDTEHTRVLWWPQKGVQQMVVWKAHTMRPCDYDDETGPPGCLKPKPYEEFPRLFGQKDLAQCLGGRFFDLIRYWNESGLRGAITRFALKFILAMVIRLFVKQPPGGPQRFWDAWLNVLPMDNAVSDKILPTRFTEMWFSLEDIPEVMRRLRDHYEREGLQATGPYACEFYGTKASRFWMSPAFDRDVFKFDPFWFVRNSGDPVKTYFPQFWDLLHDLDYRLHWGKYLPDDTASFLPSRYEHWNDFLNVRSEMDPHGIFLTDYWRTHLGL